MLGDDVARCSNGLTAQKFREATAEEQVTYRKWMRGLVFFYGALLLMSGAAAVVSHSSADLTQVTTVSQRQAAVSPKTN